MVNTGGISGSTICLTSLDLDNGYQEVAVSVFYHTFKDFPEAFQVIKTAPSRIPYRYIGETVTGVDDHMLSYIRCYPNPVDDLLYIDMDVIKGRLELYDLQEKVLLREE